MSNNWRHSADGLKTKNRGKLNAVTDIFISYRREDHSAVAELLHDRLQSLFPEAKVFLDVADIAPGQDWKATLAKRIADHEVVLVVVGPRWAEILAERALSAMPDYVHWEVAEALRQRKRVIPVLAEGGVLPSANILPADIAALARLQVAVVRAESREADILALALRVGGAPNVGGPIDAIRRLMQFLRLGKVGMIAAASVGAGTLAFAWVNLFDLAGLDTRTASITMAVGDMLFEPQISDRLKLVVITPRADEENRLDSARRADYAQLINLAAERRAASIVFDITTDEASDYDTILLSAVRAARGAGTRVVFGFKALTGDGDPVALPGLMDAGAFLGLTCIGQKLENAEFGTLVMASKERVYGSLPLHAVFSVREIESIPQVDRALTVHGDGGTSPVPFSLRETVEQDDADCPARIEGSELARLIFPLSHRERLRDPSRQATVEQVLSQRPEDWHGKLILVGAAHRLDQVQTRLDPSGPERYGFEFQADAINSLLVGNVARPIGFLAQWLLAMAMVLGAVGYRFSRVGKSRKPDPLVLLLACAGYFGVTVILYSKFLLLVDGLYHLGAFLVTWWILAIVERRWSRGRSE